MNESLTPTLFSRNPPFIDADIQKELGKLKVGIVGCGLASQPALALARLGVRWFRLWDFDVVEVSNMNRQAFFARQLGMNKALATAQILKDIDASIPVEPHGIRMTNSCLGQCLDIDIAINSADFDDPVYYDISEMLRTKRGWCLCPMNLGFGGLLLVIGPNSPSLTELTGGRKTNATGFITSLLNSCHGFQFSDDLVRMGPQVLSAGDRHGWFPQKVVATSITTALIAWSLVTIVQGKGNMVSAPRILHFEPISTSGVGSPLLKRQTFVAHGD